MPVTRCIARTLPPQRHTAKPPGRHWCRTCHCRPAALLPLCTGWAVAAVAAAVASQLSNARSTAAAARARASACQRWLNSAGPGCTTSRTVAARPSRALHTAALARRFSTPSSATGQRLPSRSSCPEAAAAAQWRQQAAGSGSTHGSSSTLQQFAREPIAPAAGCVCEGKGCCCAHLTALPSSRRNPSGAMQLSAKRLGGVQPEIDHSNETQEAARLCWLCAVSCLA